MKVDLLPKGTNFNCVGDWVVEATMKKKLKYFTFCTCFPFGGSLHMEVLYNK